MKNIKSLFLMLTLVLFASNMFAQETKEFTVDGIKVIHKYVPKDVISVRLFIEGGTANYSKEYQGIENITLNLMIEGGTTNTAKLDFKTQSEKIGTSFTANTGLDYGTIGMTCIKAFWDKSWDLYADAILNPAFTQNEFDLLQEQLIAGAQQNMANPDGYLNLLARQVAFENKDYAKSTSGTPESLENLKVEDVRNYYKKTIGKKRLFIVVVGNITEADLTAKIKASLSKLPYGSPASIEARTLITQPKTYIEDRDIATNYIMGIMSAPFANTEEGLNYRIAMAILYDRYFTELRTKRSLSYAPAAYYNRGAVSNPFGAIYISTIDPKQSMQVMVEELDKVKKEGFTEDELTDKKQEFLTTYYLTLETTANQADALGRAEMTGGWESLDSLTADVNKSKLADINAAFDKFSNVIVWTYLGKKDAVKEEDFIQTTPKEKKSRPY